MILVDAEKSLAYQNESAETYNKTPAEQILFGDEIIPGVFLGSYASAKDRDWLDQNQITHILTVATGLSPAFPDNFTYKIITVRDHPYENILAHFDSSAKFISNAIRKNGRVLVHCQAGVSRSASVIIAYLMKTKNMVLDDAWDYVSERRSIIALPSAAPDIFGYGLFSVELSHKVLGISPTRLE
ncbi:9559_t:CDS:2 [Paraglomus occultum]|uniref:protein-tyrosine-phosphatase n=1 Tax=Paraglomus occultum TaxID=144539 RepID=A0A9N8VVP7_9GLOM|nr:9559_t:CDS:2 [Paraglomus occultum]